MNQIGIAATLCTPEMGRLIRALNRAFPIHIEHREPGRLAELDAVIICDGGRDAARAAIKEGISSYSVLHDPDRSGPAAPSMIRFTSSRAVAPCLRDREMSAENASTLRPVEVLSGEEIVASNDRGPVWVSREENGRRHDFVSSALPVLKEGEQLLHYMYERRFLGLLPLIQFLKDLEKEKGWRSPPLRACFQFDDANIHWTSYGHIDYPALYRHAEKHNYHATMAMIPLDTWFTHPRTTRLFREHPDRLSLIIHGNNHGKRELELHSVSETETASLAQAAKRIDRMCERTGLRVPRIITPPHEACTEAAMSLLLKLGYEGICYAGGLLWNINRSADPPQEIGMWPADLSRDGFPVIPHFMLTRATNNTILLAAFLGHPMIPFGHQNDLKGGIDLLGEIAGRINSIGRVHWCSPAEISRMNFLSRTTGDLLIIRPFTRRLQVEVPEGITGMFLDPPPPIADNTESVSIRDANSAEPWKTFAPGERIEIPSPAHLEVRLPPRDLLDLSAYDDPRTPVRAIFRRAVTELRDRLRM